MTMERIGDAERDQTTSALSEHYAAGRLTYEEFDQRVGMATRSRTQMELDLLLHDLPSADAKKPIVAKNQRPEPTGYEAIARRARNRWAKFVLVPGVVGGVLFWWLAALGSVTAWWLFSILMVLLLVTGAVAWIRPQALAGSPRPKELRGR